MDFLLFYLKIPTKYDIILLYEGVAGTVLCSKSTYWRQPGLLSFARLMYGLKSMHGNDLFTLFPGCSFWSVSGFLCFGGYI